MPKPVAGINIQKDVDNSTKIWYYITVCTERRYCEWSRIGLRRSLR